MYENKSFRVLLEMYASLKWSLLSYNYNFMRQKQKQKQKQSYIQFTAIIFIAKQAMYC